MERSVAAAAGARCALAVCIALGAALLGAERDAGASAAAGEDAPSAPAQSRVSLGAHEYALGRTDAPLTMVEFTDYQCPFCRRFHADTWPRLKREYVDTGKLRFIVRDLPLTIHSNAEPAAEVAHCAGEQGQFWPMHDALLAGGAKLTDDYVLQKARELGLNAERLRNCAMKDRYQTAIAGNAHEAAALGIYGTPTFVIGRSAPHEFLGERLSGAQPYETFQSILDGLLAAPGQAPGAGRDAGAGPDAGASPGRDAATAGQTGRPPQ